MHAAVSVVAVSGAGGHAHRLARELSRRGHAERSRASPCSPAPYSVLDGFSPTVQILMHFPGGVDPVASNASRLLPETRTYDSRSLDADSPTVLLDVDTNTRVLHFVEPDAHAADDAGPPSSCSCARARSLTPGHRYIVAVRTWCTRTALR